MSNLANAIRHTRLGIRNENEVVLTLQSPMGHFHQLRVKNCSLLGLGAYAEQPLPAEDGFVEGSILPPAKLSWSDKTAYIGRLVLRTHRADKGLFFYGFQTIDNKVRRALMNSNSIRRNSALLLFLTPKARTLICLPAAASSPSSTRNGRRLPNTSTEPCACHRRAPVFNWT
jgi:hypothetical protein